MPKAAVLLCFCVCLQLVNCQFGLLGSISNTISNTVEVVGDILLGPKQHRPVIKVNPTGSTQDRPVSIANPTGSTQDRPVSIANPTGSTQHRPVSIANPTGSTQDRPVSTYNPPNNDASCTAVDGSEGTCVNPLSCESYEEEARKPSTDYLAQYILKTARCGADDGNTHKVCCPIRPIARTSYITTTARTVLNINYSLLASVGETCKTLHNTTGICTDLQRCKPFLESERQAGANPATSQLLELENCGFDGIVPKVCCPLPGQSALQRDESAPPSDESAPLSQATPVTTNCTFLSSVESRGGRAFLAHKLPALLEPPVCGWSSIPLDRVVGGVPATLGALPWMALLGYMDESVTSGVSWKCGGALVSTRHVLTAAHCIGGSEHLLMSVRLGELDLGREDEGATPVDIPIKDMIKHEQYSRNKPIYYDIGLLVLQREVEFTNLIRPICLFPSNKCFNETFEDYNPILAGWGNTEWRGKEKPTHLQVAQVPVVSSAECLEVYKDYIYKSKEQFSQQTMCAGYPGGQIDSCSGDSGGPLMQPLPNKEMKSFMYLIGVVSFGQMCGRSGSLGAYARVTHYMPWIEEKLLS